MNEDRIADIVIISIFLTIIGLKIANIITISWFWLFSPIIFLLGLGVILSVGLTIGCLISTYKYKRRTKE